MKLFGFVLALLFSAYASAAEPRTPFLLAQPIGIGSSFDYVTAITGVSLGYNLNGRSFISADYSHYHTPLGSDYSVKTKADSIGFDYGHYVTENLFVRGGPRVKSVVASQHQESSDPYQSAEAVRYELKVAVGHFWQWEAFLIGADWLTIALPLHTSVGANPQNRDFETKNLEFAKLWIGASF